MAKHTHTKRLSSTGKTMKLMEQLEQGESFYTDVKPKNVTHYSNLKNVNVSVQSVLVIEGYLTETPSARKITKVTILE